MKRIFSTAVGFAACFAAELSGARAAEPDALADAPIPVRGVVRAVDRADISTDLGVRAEKVNFREGEAFKAGDVLIAFDCTRYRAEAKAAEAAFREMKLTLDSNLHLEKFSAIGKHDVEISHARMDKAEAEWRGLESRLKQCEIVAPFDGRVAELSIHVFEQPQPGKTFLVIMGQKRIEMELIVPSRWLSWLKAGEAFEFQIDETKKSYQAHVARTGASVDAVSQMLKVIATFDDPANEVLPGMSGSAHFTLPDG